MVRNVLQNLLDNFLYILFSIDDVHPIEITHFQINLVEVIDEFFLFILAHFDPLF